MQSSPTAPLCQRVKSPWRLAALVVALACGSMPLPGRAQAVVDPAWDAQAGPMLRLTVLIEAAAPGSCVGSGIIVGHDARQVYVLTTAGLVLDSQGTTPREGLHAKTTLADLRRMPVRVLFHDASPDVDLAVLGIEDADLAKAASAARFDVLGHPSGSVPRDQMSVVGCADGVHQRSAARPLLQVQPATLTFHGVGLRPTMAGGPLLHIVGTQPAVVGLTLVARPRAQARHIDTALDWARARKVPVKLTRIGSDANCTYRLEPERKPTSVAGNPLWMMAPARDSFTIHVETEPTCTWTAYADASPWLAVTLPRSGGDANPERGPGRITVRVTQGNMCGGSFRRAAIYVAGQVLQIAQDSSNLGNCQK